MLPCCVSSRGGSWNYNKDPLDTQSRRRRWPDLLVYLGFLTIDDPSENEVTRKRCASFREPNLYSNHYPSAGDKRSRILLKQRTLVFDLPNIASFHFGMSSSSAAVFLWGNGTRGRYGKLCKIHFLVSLLVFFFNSHFARLIRGSVHYSSLVLQYEDVSSSNCFQLASLRNWP